MATITAPAGADALLGLYKRAPIELVRGEGVELFDAEDRGYLDFTSGIAVTSTGHCHPRVVEAIRDQAGRIIHAQVNCYRSPLRAILRR